MKTRTRKRPSKENPTLDEIRRRCAQIQSKWSPRERAKRAGIVDKQWNPPLVTMDEFSDGSPIDPGRN